MKKKRIVAADQLTIKFEGEAIQAGTIDARELGRTLVGLSDALVATNGIAGPEGQAAPTLTITGTKPGSFVVDLAVMIEAGAIQHMVDGLAGKYATAGANLSGILGIVGSVILFLKGRGDRSVAKVTDDELNPDFVHIAYEDGTVERIPARTWLVAKSATVQKSLRDVVKPVTKDGIDRIEFVGLEGADHERIVVTSDDYPGFVPFSAPLEEVKERYESLVSVEALAFEGGRKWRLSDGAASFLADIQDESFRERVDEGTVRFAKGDTFRVLLEKEQIVEGGSLKARYHVVQVLRHYPKGNISQGELF